jgi:hypothetical protein
MSERQEEEEALKKKKKHEEGKKHTASNLQRLMRCSPPKLSSETGASTESTATTSALQTPRHPSLKSTHNTNEKRHTPQTHKNAYRVTRLALEAEGVCGALSLA